MMRSSLHCVNIDQRAVLRQRPAAAIEHEAGERDVIGAARRDQRSAAGEHQPRRATHADQLRRRSAASARRRGIRRGRASAARGRPRSCRSPPAACCSARRRRRRARRAASHRRRTWKAARHRPAWPNLRPARASKGGDGEKTPAIDFHDRLRLITRSRQFKSRARKSVPRWHRSALFSTCDSVNAAAVSQWRTGERSARRAAIDPIDGADAIRIVGVGWMAGCGGEPHFGICAILAPSALSSFFQELTRSALWSAGPPGNGGGPSRRSSAPDELVRQAVRIGDAQLCTVVRGIVQKAFAGAASSPSSIRAG